ncbi:MAG: hypothetical protein BIFFINMI_03929 [Phycisphaerae bacterium]|nr:hypothetical protein [Phycisphaerae bacterium]
MGQPGVIGILSDTHGRADRARRASELLSDRGAGRLFHCGDIGGDGVVDALAGREVAYVLGNTDFDRASLVRYIRALGGVVGQPAVRTEVAGRRIAVTHGDDARLLEQLIRGGELDYVFHGHTHELRDDRIGRTRVINPGALQRARRHTVALLDVPGDRLEIIEVQDA